MLRQQSVGPLTTPDRDRSEAYGQGSADAEISLNHAGGQGWSGVETTVGPHLLDCGHSETWLARDGKRRCTTCDPPAFPTEVASDAEAVV
jgi:hypothetical protein